MVKKIKTILAVLLLCILPVMAEGLVVSSSSSHDFNLYDAYGKAIPNTTPIDKGGYIVQTENSYVQFESAYGDILLYPDSLFVVTSMDYDDASIYLIYGEANFFIKEELSLSIYTPTSRLLTTNSGEFYVRSTDNEEWFFNLSSYTANVYDDISKTTSTLHPLSFTSSIENKVDIRLDEEAYKVFSYFDTIPFNMGVPERPTIQEVVTRLNIPAAPVFTDMVYTLIPMKPEVYAEQAILYPAAPELSVRTVDLVLVPEAPRFIEEPADSAVPEKVSSPIIIETKLVGEMEDAVQVETKEMMTPVKQTGSTPQGKPLPPVFLEKKSVLKLEAPEVQVFDRVVDPTMSPMELERIAKGPNTIYLDQENDLLVGERKKNSFSVDFLLKMRAAADSESGETSLRSSIIPSLSYGSFLLQFSIDPARIAAAVEKEEELPFYLSYGISFLEALYYRSFDERFVVAIDKTTTLHGDSVGLFDGKVHDWDGINEALSLDFSIKGDRASFRLFSPDISFNNYAEENPLLAIGSDFRFNPSGSWPFRLGLEVMAELPYKQLEDTILFSSLYTDIPFMDDETMSFGMRMALTKAIDFQDPFSSLSENTGILFSFPLSLPSSSFNFGGMYQHGEVYYGRLNYSYQNQHNIDSKFALFAEGDLLLNNLQLSLNSFMNLDTQSMVFLKDESYLDLSLGFSIGNINFILGARKTNFLDFSNYFKNSDAYIGIGAKTGSLSSSTIFRFTNGKPQMTYSGSISMIDLNNDAAGAEGTDILSLMFDMGFTRLLGNQLIFEFSPILKIGGEENYLSLRIPLYLSLHDDKINLTTLKADEWWTMFSPPIDNLVLFDSITDIFTLIDGFKFSTPQSIFFLEASRDLKKNDILFDNYESFEALAFSGGLKFKNLELLFYVDDMEAPKIYETSLGIYPIDSSQGGGLIFSFPVEIMLWNFETFTLKAFPGATLHLPFLSDRLHFNFFIYGEMTAIYEKGKAPTTEIIYDFDNEKFYGYLLGGEVKWEDENVMAGVSGGIHSGLLAPNMFNSFTAFNPDKSVSASVPVDTLDDVTGGDKEEDIKENSYWMIAEFALYFEKMDMFVKYSVPDMVKMINDFENYTRDIFSFGIDFTLPNGVGMDARISREAFASTIDDIGTDFLDYFNSPLTIYSASITKSFDNLSLKAELSTGALWTKKDDTPINSYHREKTLASLTISTRIGF